MEQLDRSSNELALSILARAPDLTLATIMENGLPHASTVSFASHGLVLFAAIGIDSQKAHDIRLNPQVAVTINAPYQQWSEIQGLSIGALAEIVSEPDQVRQASELLLRRFPQLSTVCNTGAIPWPGTLFIRITPKKFSLLNYAEGFGHTSYHTPDQTSTTSTTSAAQGRLNGLYGVIAIFNTPSRWFANSS